MKWLTYLVLIALVGGAWMWFSKSGDAIKKLDAKILAVQEIGDPEGKEPALQDERSGLEGQRILTGVLLTFVSAGLAGIFIVSDLLPMLAQRATHAVYDSGEVVEEDGMREARSLEAQGEYPAAIAAYQKVAQEDPSNRLPWVEIVKIYRDYLEQPDKAIETIHYVLENIPQEPNNAAFFLFRLAEILDEDKQDRATATAMLQQVIDQFPGTRHSANATHKLHEWQVEAEEQAVIARNQQH